MLKIIVDDNRVFPNDDTYQCVRSYEACIQLLSNVQVVNFISLDYDLGDQNGKTGLSILEWLKQYHIIVKHINIHSDHSQGKIQMKHYAKDNFTNSIITMNAL